MNNKVIIFGIQDYAELAHYYLMHDSKYEIAGFTVNEKYLPQEKKFKGLPVFAYEEINDICPAADYLFFAPMSPKNMNQLRENIYYDIKAKGYQFINYISSKATTFENVHGDNCFILEDNTIQPFTEIGSNVVIWSGNHLGHHSKIGDHVTFTSHVVMSGHCDIGNNSFLGVNATLRDGLTVAKGSLIGMAAVVTKDTEEWGVYIGSPAKKLENKLSTALL